LTKNLLPRVEVIENDKNTFSCDCAGVKKEEIKLTIEDGVSSHQAESVRA